MSMEIKMNELIAQMRMMQARAGSEAVTPNNPINTTPNVNGAVPNSGPQFSEVFSEAINKVNELQQTSSSMSQAFEKGDPNVSLPQVMVAAQKSSVAFQAMTEVRNKLIKAYQDIMSMPV